MTQSPTNRPVAVLFDIGNVLIDWNPQILFEELIPDDEERKHFHDVVCPREWWIQHDAGATFEEIAAPVCERFPDKRDLIWAWHERYAELIPQAIDGSVRLLQELKDRKVQIHALTNYPADKFRIARELYPFLALFDDVVVSGEVRMIKPDPAIFALALNRMQASAHNVLFIDDHEPNIDAAKTLGFVTHHFTNPAALREDLIRHDLLRSGDQR